MWYEWSEYLKLKLTTAALVAAFLLVRPAGRIYLEVKVLYGPGKGNR